MYLINSFENNLYELLEKPDRTRLMLAFTKQYKIGRSTFYVKLKQRPLDRGEQNFIYEYILNNVENAIKKIEKAKRYTA